MESNPYSTPSANLFGSSGATGSETVTPVAITHLQNTKPWVRFLAVLLFISGGLMMLSAVAMAVGGGVGALSREGTSRGPAFMVIGMAVFYGVFGLLYLYPAMKMWKYGGRIMDLMVSRSSADLEAALNEQRIVWKFWGIITLLMICAVIAFVIVAAVVGASGLPASMGGSMTR